MNHILSLYAGKVAAFSRDDKRLEIRLDREAEGADVDADRTFHLLTSFYRSCRVH